MSNIINNAPMPAPDKKYGGETMTAVFDNESTWEYYISYIEDFRFEYDHSDSLLMFQEWVAMENFFGQRITEQMYIDLACYFNEDTTGVDGDILDLGGVEPMIEAFRAGDAAFCKSPDHGVKGKVVPCIVERLLTTDEARLYDGPKFMVRIQTDGSSAVVSYDDLMTVEMAQAYASHEKELPEDDFEDKCYEQYRLLWMLEHGFTLKDYVKELTLNAIARLVDNEEELDLKDEKAVCAFMKSIEDDIEESGLGNGALYACMEEFLDSEFLDKEYMTNLFTIAAPTNSEVDRLLSKWSTYAYDGTEDDITQEGNGHENRPEEVLTVETELGTLTAEISGDTEYPGFYVCLKPEGHKHSITTLLAEVVKAENSREGEAMFHLRPWVTSRMNCLDENGHAIDGRISHDAPIGDIALSQKDFDHYRAVIENE